MVEGGDTTSERVYYWEVGQGKKPSYRQVSPTTGEYLSPNVDWYTFQDWMSPGSRKYHTRAGGLDVKYVTVSGPERERWQSRRDERQEQQEIARNIGAAPPKTSSETWGEYKEKYGEKAKYPSVGVAKGLGVQVVSEARTPEGRTYPLLGTGWMPSQKPVEGRQYQDIAQSFFSKQGKTFAGGSQGYAVSMGKPTSTPTFNSLWSPIPSGPGPLSRVSSMPQQQKDILNFRMDLSNPKLATAFRSTKEGVIEESMLKYPPMKEGFAGNAQYYTEYYRARADLPSSNWFKQLESEAFGGTTSTLGFASEHPIQTAAWLGAGFIAPIPTATAGVGLLGYGAYQQRALWVEKPFRMGARTFGEMAPWVVAGGGLELARGGAISAYKGTKTDFIDMRMYSKGVPKVEEFAVRTVGKEMPGISRSKIFDASFREVGIDDITRTLYRREQLPTLTEVPTYGKSTAAFTGQGRYQGQKFTIFGAQRGRTTTGTILGEKGEWFTEFEKISGARTMKVSTYEKTSQFDIVDRMVYGAKELRGKGLGFYRWTGTKRVIPTRGGEWGVWSPAPPSAKKAQWLTSDMRTMFRKLELGRPIVEGAASERVLNPKMMTESKLFTKELSKVSYKRGRLLSEEFGGQAQSWLRQFDIAGTQFKRTELWKEGGWTPFDLTYKPSEIKYVKYRPSYQPHLTEVQPVSSVFPMTRTYTLQPSLLSRRFTGSESLLHYRASKQGYRPWGIVNAMLGQKKGTGSISPSLRKVQFAERIQVESFFPEVGIPEVGAKPAVRLKDVERMLSGKSITSKVTVGRMYQRNPMISTATKIVPISKTMPTSISRTFTGVRTSSILRNLSRAETRVFTATRTNVDTRSMLTPKSMTRTMTDVRTMLRTELTTRTRTPTPRMPLVPLLPPTKRTPFIIPGPLTPYLPRWVGTTRKYKRKARYQPSLVAKMLNIRSRRAPRMERLTGFEVRPIA